MFCQLRFCSRLVVLAATASASLVWPPPQSITAHGPSLALAHDFEINGAFETQAEKPFLKSGLAHARLSEATHRYMDMTALLSPLAHRSRSGPAVRFLEITVLSQDSYLGLGTRYDYNLTISRDTGEQTTFGGDAFTKARVTAFSVYGAMYGMETFLQFIGDDGRLRYSSIFVHDAPQYKWRGLMIDSGRRFFPMPLIRNLLDTMAASKLNVLHLHVSDMCRFGVESKIFPNLTDSLTGIRAGFYTQQDIADMISYAGARGVRVVPEFDVPGHARGLQPLKNEGIEFCTDASTQSQLYGDPMNRTLGVLQRLFKEMSGIFTDEVFNIGCDETGVRGRCTGESTFALERHLVNYISKDLGKKPAGWEEVLFVSAAATPDTIVDAWSGHTPSQITSTGRLAVDSAAGHFYFTAAAPGGPAGWHNCWYEIDDGVPQAEKHLLLGGEMSMWSDTYCYINQCGSYPGSPPIGHALFDPKNDAEFGHSIGGMIWPRGFVGAAAFWNYNSSLDSTSPEFTEAIWRLNDQVAKRGSWVCPSNCSCNQLEACGVPYLQPKPARKGDVLTVRSCGLEMAAKQGWNITSESKLQLRAASLCAHNKNTSVLELRDCNETNETFRHLKTAQLLHSPSGACLTLQSNGIVHLAACSSVDPSQQWAVDAITGSIVSMSGNYQGDLGGQCVTAGASTSFWTPSLLRVAIAPPEKTPKSGDVLKLSVCAPGAASQSWTVATDGKIRPAGTADLCVHIGGVRQYPATLASCSAVDTFEHAPDLAQLHHLSTNSCLDLAATGSVGSWECGAEGQPNQRWAIDVVTGAIVSESNHYAGDFGGYCLTRASMDEMVASPEHVVNFV